MPTRPALVAGAAALVLVGCGTGTPAPVPVGAGSVPRTTSPVPTASPSAGPTKAAAPVPRTSAGLTDRGPAARRVPAPVALRVPSVGIDAAVDRVGVARDGQMALPPDPDRAGWYRFGTAPGQARGSAVLAAHVDSTRYGIGQFARLASVEAGDRVEVIRADGRRLRYEVVDVQRIRKQALPLERLFARSGPPRLVVVTCGGEFDRDAGGYEDNVVVVAVPLEDAA